MSRRGSTRWRTSRASRVRALVLATGGAVVLSGCNWSAFGYDATHSHDNVGDTGVSTSSVSQLQRIWTATTGGAVTASPAVVAGVVYVGSMDGTVDAYNAEGAGCAVTVCQPVWSARTGGPVASSPAVANGVVFVGSDDDRLYALNASNGSLVWSAPTGGSVTSSPAVSNGVVYVGSDDGSLYAFNAANGALEWSTPTGGQVASSPAVVNGTVYVGTGDDLAVFNSQGARIWQGATGGAVTSSPAVVNGEVYVGSLDGRLYAYDASGVTGCTAGPVATCSPLWTATTGGGIASSPAVANGSVFVGSSDGQLHAYSAAGAPEWSTATGGAVTSSPAVANGVVYVGSADGATYGFDITDGKELWTGAAGGPISSSPVIANGILYVGDGAGDLIADRAVVYPLDPTLTSGVLSAEASDTFAITDSNGAVTSSAPPSNTGSNTRVAFWPTAEAASTDQQSCATWSSASSGIDQEGATLRVSSANGYTRGITVTKNVFDYATWVFNIHVWDTSTAQDFTQIGQFDLASAFLPSGQELPFPWTLCARAVGNTVSFIAWPSDQPQPAWDDPTYGGSVTLPAGWDTPGEAGWYIGHLHPAEAATYTTLSAGALSPAAATAQPASPARRPTAIASLP